MKNFEYAKPATLKEAIGLLGASWNDSAVLAGGTDLVASMKDLVVSPARVIDLKGIKELSGMGSAAGGFRIGALTTLDELVRSKDLSSKYRGLWQAAEAINSPQVRNRATVGGNLAQRPRCWYFRLGYGLLAQKDGKPLVPSGDNRYHAIFGNAGPAYFVSASSLAPALIAMDAILTVQGKSGPRKVKAADFFVTPKTAAERETVLQPTDILTEIQLPAVPATSASYEVSQKAGLDWPLAVASVVLTLSGGTVKSARIVMGHVAPTPWRSEAAEAALAGKAVNDVTATAAAEAAVKGATPLSRNAYKVQLARVAVKRAILAATAT
jgi:xanthine dehydrogenase YagS FAD-binding subunit